MNTQCPDSNHDIENSRRDFLKKAGLSLIAATAASSFIEVLQKVAQANGNAIITIASASLPAVGAAIYLTTNGSIVGSGTSSAYTLSRKADRSLVALSRSCLHQGEKIMTLQGSGSSTHWYCSAHGWQYSQDGVCTVGSVGSPLPRYGITIAANGDATIDTSVTTVGVPSDGRTTTEFSLSQNYPNPFNPTTTITYTLAKADDVSLKVYDLSGREVAVLVGEHQPAGHYLVNFNAQRLASGTYLYKLQAGSLVETKKMTLVK